MNSGYMTRVGGTQAGGARGAYKMDREDEIINKSLMQMGMKLDSSTGIPVRADGTVRDALGNIIGGSGQGDFYGGSIPSTSYLQNYLGGNSGQGIDKGSLLSGSFRQINDLLADSDVKGVLQTSGLAESLNNAETFDEVSRILMNTAKGDKILGVKMRHLVSAMAKHSSAISEVTLDDYRDQVDTITRRLSGINGDDGKAVYTAVIRTKANAISSQDHSVDPDLKWLDDEGFLMKIGNAVFRTKRQERFIDVETDLS